MPHTHLTGGRPPNRQTIPTTEFVALIHSLGWKSERVGELLGVTGRTVRYWLDSTRHPPKGVVILLRIIVRQKNRLTSA